jgi:hypothetical protein
MSQKENKNTYNTKYINVTICLNQRLCIMETMAKFSKTAQHKFMGMEAVQIKNLCCKI